MNDMKNKDEALFVRAVGDGNQQQARKILEKILREKAKKRIEGILGH